MHFNADWSEELSAPRGGRPVQKEDNKKSASTQPKTLARRVGVGRLLPSGPEDPEGNDRKGRVRQPGGDGRRQGAGIPQWLSQLLH